MRPRFHRISGSCALQNSWNVEFVNYLVRTPPPSPTFPHSHPGAPAPCARRSAPAHIPAHRASCAAGAAGSKTRLPWPLWGQYYPLARTRHHPPTAPCALAGCSGHPRTAPETATHAPRTSCAIRVPMLPEYTHIFRARPCLGGASERSETRRRVHALKNEQAAGRKEAELFWKGWRCVGACSDVFFRRKR